MGLESANFYTFDGLDATGKTTVLNLYAAKTGAVMIKTPPEWMKPVRKVVDRTNLGGRYLYYVLGNLWVDRYVLRPMLHNLDEDDVVLQDRSWLSTQAAHELRGLSNKLLKMGSKVAKSCVKPDLAFIFHVEPEVRRERLCARGVNTLADAQNLQFETSMEMRYGKWARNFEWRTTTFDNTRHSPDSAYHAVVDLIRRK